MSEIIKSIGEKIELYRKRKNYSQLEMAKLLHVSKSYISSFENGRRNPSIKALEKILSVLNVDIFDFFNKNLHSEYEYRDYRDYFIKKLFKNSEKWYLPNSGLWNERYMREMKGILTDKRNHRECAIIERYLNKADKIFDSPCGYGRISNLLSSRGYNVDGIDVNYYFIQLAQAEAKKKKLKVKYEVADIFDYDAKNKYDVVLNVFTSIGYFESDEKNELFIKKLCEYVKLGGYLIIETINPFGILKNYIPKEMRTTKDGLTIIQERFFDEKTSTNIERMTDKYPNGSIFKGLHCVRLYYPHELIKICQKYGLKNVDILDEDGKKKNLLGSFRMWLIFKK